MDGNEIVNLARRTYLDQFAAFVRNQFAKYPEGAAEVATQRENNQLFGEHYRIDFMTSRNTAAKDALVVELVPDAQVRFDPIEGMAGATRVHMQHLVWDDVEISHDIPGDLSPILQGWFDHWYDPDGRRDPGRSGGAVDVIHSLGVYPGAVAVDFGTASVDAFWSLVALLRDAGASQLTIRATRLAR